MRERFRLRRKLSSRHIVTAPANPNLPDSSDAPPVAQATNPSLFVTALEERSVVPLDDTQDEPSSRFKLFQGSTYGSGTLHESRSSTSGGSSLRLTAKRVGRSIKERILRKESSISSSDHEAYQAQVPEITEADSAIARYAAECSSPEPLVRSPPLASADVSTLTAHSCGDLAPLGAELPQGAKCNDGCVSFVVPQGWAATRMQDCFCLFTDMAVGYVRTVPANEAAKALASTDRLQVSSAVTATSSPVFVAPDVIQVEYTSPNGTGKG